MTRTIPKRISLAFAMTTMIALLAAPAQAAGPFPDPLCGAFNMVKAAPSFYTYAVSDGMDTAMGGQYARYLNGHDQGINGFNNMFDAVAKSGDNAQSPGCTE
jgi:hypothetical protein